MALNSLFCAAVPLSNYSLTHSLCSVTTAHFAVTGRSSCALSVSAGDAPYDVLWHGRTAAHCAQLFADLQVIAFTKSLN